MKILILANSDMGLYKFRRELLEELVKTHEVYFCVPKGEFTEKIEAIGCRFVPCTLLNRHGTNPIQELKLIGFYKKTLKEIKPDIVFTYTIKCNAYGGMACGKLGIPYVANVTGLGTAVENGGLMQKISLFLYKKGLKKAQKVFFQNTENRDFMVNRGVVKRNYDLLPGSGVNLDYFCLSPYLKGDEVNFIFVARVMKEKGIEQYIDAAKAITSKHPECHFHVYGNCEQDYEDRLKKLTEEGIVLYHGLASDMKPIYQLASCTVHPTFYPEGISNVLLESASIGRPIITTDRSGCREVVEDGVNGFVVRQRDSQDLIDKIEKFLSLSLQEREKMGIAGRKKVEKEFDRNIVIRKYMDEVNKVTKNK